MCSTLGDVIEYSGGVNREGVSLVHQGDTLSTLGNTLSTPGDVQYIRGLPRVTIMNVGGYHEYTA